MVRSNLENTNIKKKVIQSFRAHVSSGKVDFFAKYGMDFVMGKREGPYLWDITGEKRLINLHSNGGVFNLGHRNPEMMATLKKAMDDFDIGNHHLISKARADLAQNLAGSMPGNLDYVIFGVSGGEAIDLAIKVARGFTNRKQIISAIGGYHGHTGLALAAGDAKYREKFGVSTEGFMQVPFGDLEAMKAALNYDTAAVLLETIPATLGMPIPSPGYFKSIQEVCKRHGALLIMDEVQTGMGRTGKLWGFEHFNIEPDIVVIGKGLSGGIYPITATVIRKDLETVFHDDPFIHISTFGGSELGCITAGKALQISTAPDFLVQVNLLSEKFNNKLKELQQKHLKFFKGVRQLGLMMGLELKDELAGPLLTKTAYDNGLLMVYANNDSSICQFLPPLNIDSMLIDEIIERLDKAIVEARKLYPLLKLKRGVSKLF